MRAPKCRAKSWGAGRLTARAAGGQPRVILASRLAPAAAILLAGALCATSALAAEELEVTVEAATVDARGQHLVLDVEVRNPTDGDAFILLSEALVYGPELPESRCPRDSRVLAGSPGVQLRGHEQDTDESACALEPRLPGPGWRRGILRLGPAQQVSLLVALGGSASLGDLQPVRFGVSWATADELPRRLARGAYGADGVFLSARPVAGPPGGGPRIVRLFPRRASSAGVPVHRRDRAAD